MRTSPLSAIAVVALLVLAGCTGQPGVDGNSSPDASPDEFPNASAIDQSVFDTHATALANTSFTLSIETTRTDRVLGGPSEENFTYVNDSSRILVEPDASQYLGHSTDHFSGTGSIYSNGSTEYVLFEDNSTTVREPSSVSVFNESSDRYLWRGLFDNDSDDRHEFAAIDATFQREGVETFRGVPVMRYEATGVDALSDSWAGGENASSWYEDFSATLLLDEDGVIRHYEYEFVWTDYHTRKITKSYTLSDVGSTDVEKPGWAADATAGS